MSSGIDWLVFAAVLASTMVADRILCARTQAVSFRSAAVRSLLWLGVGLGFTGWVAASSGAGSAMSYLTAYLVEKSLSVDNLFVFLVIFRHFRVTDKQQERVLFWGVFGAVVLRAVFIVVGTSLLHHFRFMFYVFGAFLVFSGLRLLRDSSESVEPEKSIALVFARRFLRTTPSFSGTNFFVTIDGKRYATLLLLTLLVVELTDVVFAVDSVPAVLGISDDLYVVYTSNIMAILGLRALYFLLSGMMGRFHKLNLALAAVLVFVGAKMLLHGFVALPNWVSLAVIGGLLGGGIAASLLLPAPPESAATPPPSP